DSAGERVNGAVGSPSALVPGIERGTETRRHAVGSNPRGTFMRRTAYDASGPWQGRGGPRARQLARQEPPDATASRLPTRRDSAARLSHPGTAPSIDVGERYLSSGVPLGTAAVAARLL